MTTCSPTCGPLDSVAVVVPTHGRALLVERLLASLSHARESFSGEVEVIIVDSSPAAEGADIEEACARHSARYLRGPVNVRRKRNLGARTAVARYLAFIDSDCQVASDLFLRHAEALARTSTAAGSVGVTWFAGSHTWVSRLVAWSPFVDAFTFAETMEFVPWSTMTNTVLPWSEFEAVGGFDEGFPFLLGGDDVDLTWRLTVSGTFFVGAPNAVVYHDWATWSRLRDVCGRIWRWGRVDHHLERKHPAQLVRTVPVLPAWLLVLAGGVLLQVQGRWGSAPVAVVVLVALIMAVTGQRMRRGPPPPWAARPMLGALRLLFGVGRGLEAVRHGRLPSLFRRLVFDHPAFPGDVSLRWHLDSCAHAAWRWVIGLAALIVIQA